MYFLMYFYSSLFLALHVSSAASIVRSTSAAYSHRYVYGFGKLVHWSRYWLGHPHTFSMVIVRVCLAVLKNCGESGQTVLDLCALHN
jgi:hypothetical protein